MLSRLPCSNADSLSRFVNQLPAVIVPAEPYSNVNPTPSRSEDEIFSALADIVSRLTVTANNVEQAHTPAQFDRGAYLEELAIKESILRTLQQFHLSDDRFKEREMRWKEIEDQRLRAQLCKPRDVFSSTSLSIYIFPITHAILSLTCFTCQDSDSRNIAGYSFPSHRLPRQ